MKKYLTAKNGIIALTFCLILGTGIYTRQNPLYMIPLCISLLVMALQSEVNRLGYLIGSLNSLIYAGVYLSMGIYGTALSAITISFPLQLMTFLRWRKNAYKQSTVFRKLPNKIRLLLGVSVLVIFGVLYGVLMLVQYNYALWDLASFLNGLVGSILCLLAFVEFSYLNLLGGVFTIALNVQVMCTNPAHITYLVYSLYSGYCIVCGFINIHKLYKEQQLK